MNYRQEDTGARVALLVNFVNHRRQGRLLCVHLGPCPLTASLHPVPQHSSVLTLTDALVFSLVLDVEFKLSMVYSKSSYSKSFLQCSSASLSSWDLRMKCFSQLNVSFEHPGVDLPTARRKHALVLSL